MHICTQRQPCTQIRGEHGPSQVQAAHMHAHSDSLALRSEVNTVLPKFRPHTCMHMRQPCTQVRGEHTSFQVQATHMHAQSDSLALRSEVNTHPSKFRPHTCMHTVLVIALHNQFRGEHGPSQVQAAHLHSGVYRQGWFDRTTFFKKIWFNYVLVYKGTELLSRSTRLLLPSSSTETF